MLYIEVMNLKKYFGDRLILSIDSLKIYKGDKIGIVGRNGSGKTTLLNILACKEEIDEGVVNRYVNMSYIRQLSYDTDTGDYKLLKEFKMKEKSTKSKLSGGEMTRLKLANAFNKNNALILADEPTANLDYEGIRVLKQKLLGEETLVLVSHDRNLLDELCNKMIEIDDGKVTIYEGNYSAYEKQKISKIDREYFEYDQYIKEKRRLEEAIKDRQGKSKKMLKTPKRMGNSEARLHKRATTEIQEKINNSTNALKTRLEKLETKSKPKELPEIKIDFSLTSPPENKVVISCETLDFRYDGTHIFDQANFKIYNKKKTAIVGENGCGKTTLLNLIYEKKEGVKIVPKAVMGYFYQGFENLEMDKTILENVMKDSIQNETTARTILGRLLISGDDVHKKAEVLSGGERIKVSFAKLFVSNANVLLLDEPTNYLDMESIKALENILCEYEGTVLFVSHDRKFVNMVADRLLVVNDKKLTEFDGNLDSYMEQQKIRNTAKDNKVEKLILEMKLTNIVYQMSLPKADKEKLEEEYVRTFEEIKRLG